MASINEMMTGQVGGNVEIDLFRPRNGSKMDRRLPYVSANFGVELDGIFEAIFSECSALEMKTEVFTYNEGGLNSRPHQFPTRTTYSNITLKRGLTDSEDFWNWCMRCVMGRVERRNLSIVVVASHPSVGPSRRWNVINAYPIKWSSDSMKTTNNAFMFESIELVHDGIMAS